MTHWLIPANPKFYDVFTAFAQDQTFWPVNAKIMPGDVIYIYLAAPYQQIAYMGKVLATNIALETILGDVQPLIKGDLNTKTNKKSFMQLQAVQCFDLDKNSPLVFQKLKAHGLTGMLMGARKLENNPALFEYIRRNA